ncbi:SPFH domain-containing protein [Rhodococcus sp. WMMA185]|uniref:SPFH domain-containing protein n=1 Tax=Rhodococcus sp. WMMA185 TaxID=679318 RepID=UPI0012F4A2A5|nr:SPFH domain-containing protein [Rhodococcus sp. WMMA185]
MIRRRIPLTAVALAVGALALSGCTVVSNEPDQAAVDYNGGPFQAIQFDSCVQPSERAFKAITDNYYQYPAGQRTFVFDNATNGDGNPIGDNLAYTAPSKDQIQLTVSGQMRFQLNTEDCSVFQEFHEKIGRKYDNGEDWSTLLSVYLSQPLNRAITDATQQFGWADLYSNIDGAQGKWESKLKELLPTYIEQATGNAAYFPADKIGITLQKPAVSPEMQKSIEGVAQAIQDNRSQQERNTQVLSEAQGLEPLKALFNNDQNALVAYLAIKAGKLNGVLPIPAGSPVIVQPN